MPDTKSEKLICRTGSVLLVVDMQEKLGPSIRDIEGITVRTLALIQSAAHLQVPTIFTEQYPKGLGHTNPDLIAAAPNGLVLEKIHFNAAAEQPLIAALKKRRCRQIIVTGTEAHVCVLQTVIGLHNHGLDVLLVTDATGSRSKMDKRVAIDRLCRIGVTCVTTEMVMFEWLRKADTDEFRKLLPIIRSLVPEPERMSKPLD